MSEADRVSIANKACLAAGVNIIDSFTDGSSEATFINEWYELTVEAELSIYKWRFATRSEQLTLLEFTPPMRYDTAYQVPNGVLSVDTVMVNDRPVEYERQRDQIHMNNSSGDDVICQYRYRADETLWNPYFTLLVVYRLATMLSFSLSRKEEVAAAMKGLADEHWRRAKTEDAQAQTNAKLNLSRLKRGRHGRMDKPWRNR